MAGGDGAWKVAYADFLTAMMAFFMVMWLVGQNSKMKEAVAEHFQHGPLEEFFGNENFDEQRKSGGPRKRNGRCGKLKGDSAKIPSPSESPEDPPDEKARLLIIHDSQRTNIGTMVPFAEHSAELSEEGTRRLSELIPLIDGKPQKIDIRGHCTASLDEDLDRQRRNERVEVYLLNEYAKDFQGTRQERERRYIQDPSASNRPSAEKSHGESPAQAHGEAHGETHAEAHGESAAHASAAEHSH